MPKVSVVLPVYNGASFLAEAVESVLSQTLHDWELIIVDDGSIDATPEVIHNFQDPRVSSIRQPNQGAATARNVGLLRARGKYIAFLDADDLYLPTAFTDTTTFLENHLEYDIVFSNGCVQDANGKNLMQLSDLRPGPYTGFILDHIVLDPHVVSFPVCTLSRRDTVRDRGVKFDPQLTPSEDWDFWIQLARYARFGYLDKMTCIYRVHGNNTTSTTETERRRLDLTKGRLKAMNAPWFQDLTLETQRRFFYHLLIALMSGEIDSQNEVLRSNAFRSLPSVDQASTLRLIATDYLLKGTELAFAQSCLKEAVRMEPADPKNRWLWNLMRVGPTVCQTTVRLWHYVHLLHKRLFSIGQPSPIALDKVMSQE